LRGGVAALTRRARHPAAPALPRRQAGAGLLPRPRRAVALREDPDGDLAGHPVGGRHGRLPAQSVANVHMVRPPGALPGVRRHSTSVSRLARHGCRRVSACYYRRLGRDGDEYLFEPTTFSRSNWDPQIQHGSPPLALLTKAIEELSHGSEQRI